MISSALVQRDYNRLYKELRRYIWDFQVVESIADLEIEVYRLCPTMMYIREKFEKLRSEIREIEYEDEDLKKSMDRFEDTIYSDDDTYAKLNKVMEVLPQ